MAKQRGSTEKTLMQLIEDANRNAPDVKLPKRRTDVNYSQFSSHIRYEL